LNQAANQAANQTTNQTAPPPAGSPGLARNLSGIFQVGPEFFETMQIPLRAGRGFSPNDGPGAPHVAVINEQLGKVNGVENPVGRTVRVVNDSYEIVGVVKDALWLSLKQDSRPMVYLPYMQNPRIPAQMWYEVRAAGNPLDYAKTVREVVRQLDSRIAVAELKSQRAMIDQTISQEITLARLCTGFAILALIIACVGLYGTVAYHVARRTHEIGLRMALGAQRGRVVWMVLRQVVVLVGTGLAIGLPIAYATSHLVESFLFGMKAKDPLTMLGAAALLAVAAIAAACAPAWRASKIDAMIALRHE
jgi:predicted permease